MNYSKGIILIRKANHDLSSKSSRKNLSLDHGSKIHPKHHRFLWSSALPTLAHRDQQSWFQFCLKEWGRLLIHMENHFWQQIIEWAHLSIQQQF